MQIHPIDSKYIKSFWEIKGKSLAIILETTIFSYQIFIFLSYTMLDQIKLRLEQANKIALFWHEHIDGDALGAILWLGKLLEKQGKEVYYFTPHQPGHVFNFLQLGEKIQYSFDYAEYDLLVFLDFNQYERIWLFTFGKDGYFDAIPKIIIDHHKPEPEPKNTLIYRDCESISTCWILYELTKNWRWELLDEEIATFFYMGLATDSGNFRYDEGEQSIKAFSIATELLKLGAKKKLIIDEVFRNKTYRSVQFMQLILQRMQKIKIQVDWNQTKTINLIYSFYEDNELEQFGIDHEEADYGLYIMQDIRNNELVVLIKKIDLFIKASLRGRGYVDCSSLAKVFWGGWHHNAAWFKIQWSGYFEKDIQDILRNIEGYFEEKKL